MTRAEHLEWCKKRALEYLNEGDVENAIASMMSDLSKHPETKNVGQDLGMLGMMIVNARDVSEARRFIVGFN